MLSISIRQRGDGTALETWHYKEQEDLPYAGFTCDDCPQPLVTAHIGDYEAKDYTKRCKECARKHAAHKRIRRMTELFRYNRPLDARSIVAVTLTFGDDDIDKEQRDAWDDEERLRNLRQETVRRFRRLRERSDWWQSHMLGGISSFECTRNKETQRYHPHLHIVCYTTLQYPYPLDEFRHEIQEHGFGKMGTIETAYTHKRKTNKDGTFVRDSKGDYVTYKCYSDPEGALFYALKYALKDSMLAHKKGRTVTKFGTLYGKKWNTNMSAYKRMLDRRYTARHAEHRPMTPVAKRWHG